MRIIIITDLPIWSMGEGKGGEAFTRTIRKYKESGDELILVSDVESDSSIHLFDEGNKYIIHPSFFLKFARVRKLGCVFRILNHWIVTCKFEKTISRIIGERGSENTIIYAYEIFGVKAGKKISRIYKIPLVTRFQGTQMLAYRYNIINKITQYPHFQALRTKADLVIMTDDGTMGDCVLDCVNNTSDRLFLKNGLELLSPEFAEKIVNIDRVSVRKRMSLSDDDMIFLTVSRLTGWKRVDRAISGFNDFVRRGGKGKLVIVGDGDQRHELENMVSKLGINSDVVFVGAVKHENVYEYMIASDVFLSFFDLSNVGNPLLEAMSLGKCIITLDTGNTKSLIDGSTGIILKVEELGQLGKVMIDIASDKNLREKLGNEAKSLARNSFMTWDERMNVEYKKVKALL